MPLVVPRCLTHHVHQSLMSLDATLPPAMALHFDVPARSRSTRLLMALTSWWIGSEFHDNAQDQAPTRPAGHPDVVCSAMLSTVCGPTPPRQRLFPELAKGAQHGERRRSIAHYPSTTFKRIHYLRESLIPPWWGRAPRETVKRCFCPSSKLRLQARKTSAFEESTTRFL